MEQRIPLEEQETTINLYPPQVSKTAEVYTCMPVTMKKLKKLASDRPELARITSDNGVQLTAEVDRSCIKIQPKRRVSEQQRQAAAERFAAARAAKEESP